MKKLTCYLLALALAIGCVCLLASCKEEENTQSVANESTDSSETVESSEQAEESKYETPDGYQLYDDGNISFAYPDDWTVTDGSTVILMGTENTNNITVAYETKTDMYEKWDASTFNSMMKPTFESMGASVSNVKVEQKKKGSLHVTEISCSMIMQEIEMKQTIYVVSTANKTYSVTVTEVVSDAALVSNVYDSLTVLK